ncbi:site-specific DNA-methyltransferase [soil metagenome]
MTEGNVLYYGDNLDVLRRHVADESVDLIYLDPPFNSNADYNLLFSEHGQKAAAQVQAFSDTWTWDEDARRDYEEIVEAGGPVADRMRAFYTMLGGVTMMAYLARMSLRLVELRRVLKRTGSLYLHCDPTASHYLKLLLDAIFGPTNFRNEIIWRRTGSNSAAKRYGPLHQTIFYYRMSAETPFYPQTTPYTLEYIDEQFNNEDERGRYQAVALTGPGRRTGDSGKSWRHYDPDTVGRHWQPATYVYAKYRELTGKDLAQYPLLERLDRLDQVGLIHWGRDATKNSPRYKFYSDDAPGVMLQDIWSYIPGTKGCVYGRPDEHIDQDVRWLSHKDAESLGYPTQKPTGVMLRLIQSSTVPGDVVLDPFCGCGTTIDAAQHLGRRWIGIDITHLAIGLIKNRLVDRYGPEIATTYATVGEPTTVDDARVLARGDPFQFQAWALGLVGARVAGSDKKGGDKGIDGRLYFHDSANGPTRQIVLSVKAGQLVPTFVDAMWGVIQREEAEIGVLISFQQPTAGMRARAAEAGFYESPWGKHPRIQLRTVGELLEGKGIDYPHVTGANVTHRRAKRARSETGEQLGAFSRAAEEPEPYGQ